GRGGEGAARRLLPRGAAGRRADPGADGRLTGARPALRLRPGGDEAPRQLPAPPVRGAGGPRAPRGQEEEGRGGRGESADGGAVQRRRVQGGGPARPADGCAERLGQGREGRRG